VDVFEGEVLKLEHPIDHLKRFERASDGVLWMTSFPFVKIRMEVFKRGRFERGLGEMVPLYLIASVALYDIQNRLILYPSRSF
jgi:hypothetical protein